MASGKSFNEKTNFVVEELKVFLEAPVWITTVWKTNICYGNFNSFY